MFICTTNENTFLKKLLAIFRLFTNLLRTSLLEQKLHKRMCNMFAIVANKKNKKIIQEEIKTL